MLSIYNNLDITPLEEHAYTLHDIVEGMGYDLGLSDYPIFDEAYRARLNSGIYDHFRYRRIAADTPAMFIYYLNRSMREGMPTYNALYRKVNEQSFDPFATATREEGGTAETAGESTASSEGTAESTATVSSTPATYLSAPEGQQYMDSLTKNGSSTGGTDRSSTSGSDSYSRRARASDGYLDTAMSIIDSRLLDVDYLVYRMLEPLFIQFWDDLQVY